MRDDLEVENSGDVPELALLQQLIAETQLYSTEAEAQALFDFVSRLRGLAPFNAMLIHIQKPGITHVATARDWAASFDRYPKPDARPLIVLRSMGPVDFVFDLLDTEGADLPDGAFCFPVIGWVSDDDFNSYLRLVEKAGIAVKHVDSGDAFAGQINCTSWDGDKTKIYEIALNGNHPATVQLVTLAHELAHLFLGHLGGDLRRKVRDRSSTHDGVCEVEAEAVAWLVARRNGLKSRSESYLKEHEASIPGMDFHAVMRAVNEIEKLLGISALNFMQTRPIGPAFAAEWQKALLPAFAAYEYGEVSSDEFLDHLRSLPGLLLRRRLAALDGAWLSGEDVKQAVLRMLGG